MERIENNTQEDNNNPETEISIDTRIESVTTENYKEVLQAIIDTASPVTMEIYAGKLAKQLDVNKNIVIKELKGILTKQEEDNKFSSEVRAVFPGLVDVVHTNTGSIKYLIRENGELRLTDTWLDDKGITVRPPDSKHIQFLLPNAENVMRLYTNDDDKTLYEELVSFFKRFSYLEDNVWPIIVLSVFLSYIQDHEDVRYLPVIYFYAVAERGKSKTAKTMLATSYRGIHLADIRSANIFRFAQNWNATMFFDLTDIWRSADKGDGQDILLGRFEKGTRVVRVQNSEKGAFADQVFYDIYGSTIVATNEPANITFESRCLTITMPNKPGDYENLNPKIALPFKERLTAWRARMMNRDLPHLDMIPGISGRLWDISKPLFQLALMISDDAFEQMKAVILAMAGQKIEDKKESAEGQLVAVIDSLAEFNGNLPIEISHESIRCKLNEGKPDKFNVSSQKLSKRIKSLSINTKTVHGYSKVIITAPQLKLLKEQYGLIDVTTADETTLNDAIPVKKEYDAYISHDLECEIVTVNSTHLSVVGSGRVSQGVETSCRSWEDSTEQMPVRKKTKVRVNW